MSTKNEPPTIIGELSIWQGDTSPVEIKRNEFLGEPGKNDS